MDKILLIDDSKSAISLMKSYQELENYSISSALSGAQALVLLEKDHPDCILCDYEMPEMNGPQFCKIIKNNDKLKQIPIIILTGNTNTEHLLQAIDAGADDYITKNTDIRIIIAKINAMIRLKKANEGRVKGIKQIIITYNHELNNPLAIAIGCLDIVVRGINDELLLGRIKKAQDALGRMTKVIAKIRDLKEYNVEDYDGNSEMISIKSIHTSD